MSDSRSDATGIDCTDVYDLVIVGGGLSGSRLLINLLDLLLDGRTLGRPLRVGLLDRIGAFGGGIPYGSRTTLPGFLLIESVAESTPPEFQNWLRNNRSLLTVSPSDAATAAWLETNSEAIAANRLDDLFVPRRLFGYFLAGELRDRVQRASALGLAHVAMLTTDAEDVQPDGGTLRIDVAGGRSCSCQVAVLAVGCIPSLEYWALAKYRGYVHRPYSDAFESLSSVITERAAQNGPVDILIIGSGAGASEIVHYLAHSPALIDVIRTVQIVSVSGRLAGSAHGAPCAPGSESSTTGVRPSAREYAATAARLARLGMLSVRRGLVVDARELDSSRLQLDILADGQRSSAAADVVVNCAGTGKLAETDSMLLRNLAAPTRPFKLNRLRTGFALKPGSLEVDGVDGCFVIGPLLNQHPESHVESILAVYRVAKELAPTIHERLLRAGDSAFAASGSEQIHGDVSLPE
jgi:uncharacterized NAD(P)/FAD-binding protein YdhS